MKQTISIRIDIEDYDRLKKECVKELLKDNPTLDGINFTTRYMIKRIINYYLHIEQ